MNIHMFEWAIESPVRLTLLRQGSDVVREQWWVVYESNVCFSLRRGVFYPLN